MGWVGVVVTWPAVVGTSWAARCAAVLDRAGIPVGPAGPGDGLVLVDERCPGLGSEDLLRVVDAAQGAVAVGVRPVTDTVKELSEGYVGRSVDRDGLVAVCSPVVVPADLRDGVGPLDGAADLVRLVAGLDGVPVVHVEVAGGARRLGDASELVLLEGLEDLDA